MNSGQTDIDGSDIHYLRWLPPEGTKILSAEVVKQTEGYGDFCSLSRVTPDTLNIEFLAFNEGTSVRIGVLCSSTKPDISFDTARFDGVVRGAQIIDLSTKFSVQDSGSFIGDLLAGGVWTNLAKLAISAVLSLGLLISIGVSVDKIRRVRLRRKIRKTIASDGKTMESLLHHIKSIGLNKDIEESVIFFNDLDSEQIQVVLRVAEGKLEKLREFLFGQGLTEYEKSILSRIPDQKMLYESILEYPMSYEVQLVGQEVSRSRGLEEL